MDPSLALAAAGLRARVESLEVLGNNIANANTVGFKADREFYNLYVGLEAEAGAFGDVAAMPVVEGSAVDFAQGVLTPTGGPLDLALSGPGFFAVSTGQGVLYTRNGSFQRSPDGRLQTQEGFAVLGADGPLQLGPGEVRIADDGSVSVEGQPAGQLQLVEFASASSLAKVGRSYFRAIDAQPPTAATRAMVRQGQLEAANVNAAEAAVRLVSVGRQFEMLSRAASLVANEMNRRAIEELPRAGN